MVPGRKFSTSTSARSSNCLEDPAPLGVLQIERQTLLVPVDAEEVRAFFTDEGRSPPARVVAAAGLLDLDDPRAHVGEQHRAVGPGQHARQIDDEQPVQRWRGIGHRSRVWACQPGTLKVDCPPGLSPSSVPAGTTAAASRRRSSRCSRAPPASSGRRRRYSVRRLRASTCAHRPTCRIALPSRPTRAT